jgi:hypothetical protein
MLSSKSCLPREIIKFHFQLQKALNFLFITMFTLSLHLEHVYLKSKSFFLEQLHNTQHNIIISMIRNMMSQSVLLLSL